MKIFKYIKFILAVTIFCNLAAADQKLPLWIDKDPDNQGKYFRGISTWYGTDDYRMKDRAYKDALNNGYISLGSYFGMNIKSELVINKKIDDSRSSKKIKQNITAKSNQMIFNIKPVETFRELDEDKKHFRLYILLKLDDKTDVKIKKEMRKDEKEFELLKEKVIGAIEKKDYFKAENFLELAKGKRAAYMDDTLDKLKKRLEKLKKGMLLASINIDKTTYMPKEQINIEVSINQDGYLYIFYDTGDDIEMLFPNKYQRKAKLKANDMVIFPNEDIYLEAYEESLNKDTKLFAVASKKHLNIKKHSIDKIDGIYIFEKEGKQNDNINRCINQGECTKNIVNFKVSKQNGKNISIIYKCDSEIKNKIQKAFASKGIISQKSDQKLSLDVKRQSKYSSILESNVETYKITAKFYSNGKLKKERTLECDGDMLKSEVVNLYSEFAQNI